MKQYLKMAGITVATMFVFNRLGSMNGTFADWLGPKTVGDNFSGLLDSLMFWRKK